MSAQIALSHHPVTKYIYNHDILNCTAEGVVGNHLYSGRALGLTEPWDMIQLHEDLKPLWADITSHYDRIGLTHTHDVIWYLNLKELGAHVGALLVQEGGRFLGVAVLDRFIQAGLQVGPGMKWLISLILKTTL